MCPRLQNLHELTKEANSLCKISDFGAGIVMVAANLDGFVVISAYMLVTISSNTFTTLLQYGGAGNICTMVSGLKNLYSL